MIQLSCLSCNWSGPDADLNRCPNCDGVIEITYGVRRLRLHPRAPGIWRYASLLPLHDHRQAVSLGEGQTPLTISQRIGPALGLSDLHFKQEGLNPTGSYKDRIAAVGISRLKELGQRAWAATSSGNAGAAMAAYSARASLEGYLFTLEKAAPAKLAQIAIYGAHLYAVKGLGYDPAVDQQTWRNIQAVCRAKNWAMLVTARSFSPHAMEGAKTIAYEIAEQLRPAPDVVYVPVGGGGLLSACWKGFVEWHALGRLAHLPRIVAVQSQGCDPITQAWQAGRPVRPIDKCTSAISGLQLAAPPDGALVLAALTASNGWAVSIADEDCRAAQAELARQEGVFVEPAAAITLAAVTADLASGRLRGDERVVCCLTGSGFKDSAGLSAAMEKLNIPRISVDDILQVTDRE
jgi:threonine synthase